MNAAIVQSPIADAITWYVVIERSSTQRLHSMRLHADMPIKTVMGEILALYRREQPWWHRCLSQHVVEIATIELDTDVDIESRYSVRREVRITRRRPSNLTWATHHMSAVNFDTPIATHGLPIAILLRPKHTYIGLCTIAIAVLLAIAVPGALLGVMVGQAELGIALSAAITGVFALVCKFCGYWNG